MVFEGCQSKSREITITEKACPRCGAEIEVFSVDTEVTCEACGFTIYNDALSCVQWCQYAKQCVGEEMYQHMMEVAAAQKKKMKMKQSSAAV